MFTKKAANPRSELQTPGEIKRREVELGSHSWVDCVVAELFSKTPGEIKRREVELGSRSWVDCLVDELFLNSCFSDTVFVTLLQQLLKEQLAEYTICFALAGSPPP